MKTKCERNSHRATLYAFVIFQSLFKYAAFKICYIYGGSMLSAWDEAFIGRDSVDIRICIY